MSAQSTAVRPAEQVAAPVTVVPPADHTRGLRVCGAVGVAAGLLFAAMVVWEHAAGFESPGDGVPGAINAGGFLLASAGFVVLALGLYLARPGGSGRVARSFPALLAGAWTALVAGSLLDQFTSLAPEANALYPIGGLAQAIGLVGLGVTVVRARQWSGWRRLAPLGVGVYFAGALFVPAVAGVEPSTVLEVGWALGYSGLGLALFLQSSRKTGRRSFAMATGLASAGVLMAAFLVPTSGAETVPAPVRANPPIVDDGRWGGPDVYEAQGSDPVEDGRWGGPDVYEPRPPGYFEDGRQGASFFDSTDTVYRGRRPS